jgi:hypothetical protein
MRHLIFFGALLFPLLLCCNDSHVNPVSFVDNYTGTTITQNEVSHSTTNEDLINFTQTGPGLQKISEIKGPLFSDKKLLKNIDFKFLTKSQRKALLKVISLRRTFL